MSMENCCNGCKPICKGLKLVVLGVVLIVNEIYFGYNGWLLFGSLLVLGGLAKAVLGGCLCNKFGGGACCTHEKKDESKKKKHR
jgi:hypothetical protein